MFLFLNLIMSQIFKTIATLMLGILLFVGIITVSSPSFAAVTQQEAKNIIQDSDSFQEAGRKLRANDASEKVRDRTTLDLTEDVSDRNQMQDQDRRDKLMGKTKEKLKETAETVKERLNLDEPVPQSTKEFEKEVKEGVNEALGKPKSGIGYFQRKPEARN